VKLAIVAFVAALVLGCSSAGAETRHLRVLFVGNSLTATNDLPGMVSAVAKAVGHVQVDGASYAPGGYALEDHWSDGAARSLLDQGGWDAIVMQQGPSSLPESGRNLTQWANRWADEARTHGARPALLTVWPERARSYAFAAVVRNYRAAAVSSRSALFPAGAAWQAAFARSPRLGLYGPDAFHPSRLGTYLAAVVAYAGLTGELPRPLPAIPGVVTSAKTLGLLRLAAAAAYAGGSHG
jgi:hypothetical protein